MHAVVTGCRHTVGYAVTLRLLRCGARVLGTSRFPGAALLNFSREPDFESWRGRLQLMACDFLQPTQVGGLLGDRLSRSSQLLNKAATLTAGWLPCWCSQPLLKAC